MVKRINLFMKDYVVWGVIEKQTNGFWVNTESGQLSIYDTKAEAKRNKGCLDRIIKLKVSEYGKED